MSFNMMITSLINANNFTGQKIIKSRTRSSDCCQCVSVSFLECDTLNAWKNFKFVLSSLIENQKKKTIVFKTFVWFSDC